VDVTFSRILPEKDRTNLYEEFVALTKIGECHYCGSNIVWSEFQTRVKGSKKRQGTNSYGNYILNSLERNKMKCFRIESGGERFYWAGESQEGVLAEFKDNYDDFDDPAEILELSDDEMASITVTVEDENTEPNDTSTLKQLFDDKTKTCIGGDFELCGSVF